MKCDLTEKWRRKKIFWRMFTLLFSVQWEHIESTKNKKAWTIFKVWRTDQNLQWVSLKKYFPRSNLFYTKVPQISWFPLLGTYFFFIYLKLCNSYATYTLNKYLKMSLHIVDALKPLQIIIISKCWLYKVVFFLPLEQCLMYKPYKKIHLNWPLFENPLLRPHLQYNV